MVKRRLAHWSERLSSQSLTSQMFEPNDPISCLRLSAVSYVHLASTPPLPTIHLLSAEGKHPETLFILIFISHPSSLLHLLPHSPHSSSSCWRCGSVIRDDDDDNWEPVHYRIDRGLSAPLKRPAL